MEILVPSIKKKKKKKKKKTLHFCLRGNEAQSKLKKTDLLFTTIEGERAIVLNADFLSKNHQGGVAGSSSETKGAVTKPEMVASKPDSEHVS